MNALKELDKLISSLDGATTASADNAGGDAIDAVLAEPFRTTEVRSLRNDDVMNRFRQELSDGLIRVDTVGQVLRLVNTVVTYALAAGA